MKYLFLFSGLFYFFMILTNLFNNPTISIKNYIFIVLDILCVAISFGFYEWEIKKESYKKVISLLDQQASHIQSTYGHHYQQEDES